MRAAFVPLLVLMATSAEASPAVDLFTAFKSLCVETAALPAAATVKADSEGWIMPLEELSRFEGLRRQSGLVLRGSTMYG